MKGQKDLTSYINGIIKSNLECDFYIVDMKFWISWCEYTKWSDQEERKNLFNSPNKFSNLNDNMSPTNVLSITFSKEIKPKISTNKIADQNGKIYQGLIYNKDYVIITSKMWELFKFWYINLGPDLKRSKILNEIKSCNDLKEHHSKTNDKIYEIEIYPIFVKFYSFEDILSKSDNKSKLGMLELLVEIEKLTNPNQNEMNFSDNIIYSTSKLFPFSKFTKFKKILSNLEIAKKYDFNKCRLWTFYQNKFQMVNLDSTLEEMNISDFVIIVCEIIKDKKWPSENLDKIYKNSEFINEGQISRKSSSRKNSKTSYYKVQSKFPENCISNNFEEIFIGLTNIGNTCYMNSVLQILLNSPELKNFLLKENILDCINYKNRFGAKGLIMKEFINLFRQKYSVEDNNKNKKSLVPKQLKEIIEKFNSQFEGTGQQDAHDFLNYLIDILHEEINFKSEKEFIENPFEYNSNFLDFNNSDNIPVLSLEYWANNLRRNCSYIHSLFLGQLKSSLTCQRCNYEKITYETFTSISLPIPQGEKIILEVILFRLPFTFKVYYNNNDDFKFNQNGGNSNLTSPDRREVLKMLRNKSIELNTIALDDSILSEHQTLSVNMQPSSYYSKELIGKTGIPNRANGDENNQIKAYVHINNNIIKQSTGKTISSKQVIDYGDKHSISSNLVTNIPVRIKIEIDRKEEVEKIISMIKKIRDLELEQEYKINNNDHTALTNLLIFSQGNFISTDKNFKIDDCFQNKQIIHIYELLNSRGIDKLFNYQRSDNFYSKENFRELDSTGNSLENFNKKLMGLEKEIRSPRKNINSEVLIQISHRYPTYKDIFLFNKISYKKLETYFNVILLSKQDPIKISHLYDYIWDKFEYFLSNPSKFEKYLWWRSISNNNLFKQELENNKDGINTDGANHFQSKIKICSPFVLKLINRTTKSCSTCPWFRFCDGCILDPRQDYLKINKDIDKDFILVIEWCSEIIRKDINENNLKLILTHPSVNKVEDAQSQRKSKGSTISIDDCLNLFTEKEELNEENGIKCSNCKHVTSFYKKYQIQKLPPYLIIVLKRFKYTRMYKNKIESMINFPIRDLDLSLYKDNKDCSKLKENFSDANVYDLNSIIYHSGSLTGGHYISIVKHEIIDSTYEKNDNFEKISTPTIKWVKYDDSIATEVEESNILSSNAYILVYKIKDKKIIENNDYSKLIYDNLSKFSNFTQIEDSKIKVKSAVTGASEEIKNISNLFKSNLVKSTNTYFKGNGAIYNLPKNIFPLSNEIKVFYVGEPVNTIYGRGCVVENYTFEKINFLKIKLKFGYALIR
jgi:ubiquitin C-terminal hydrolase